MDGSKFAQHFTEKGESREEKVTYLIKLHAPIALVVVRVGHRAQGAICVFVCSHALRGVDLVK
jgi:hypothetical protein